MELSSEFKIKPNAVINFIKDTAKSDCLYWTKEEACHLVFTHVIVIKFYHIPRAVYLALKTVFKKPPELNQTSTIVQGKISQETSLKGFPYNYQTACLHGIVSPFVYDLPWSKLRIIRFSDHSYTFINDKYLSLISWDRNEKVRSSGIGQAIYLLDGLVMIQPMKSAEDEDNIMLLDDLHKNLSSINKKFSLIKGGFKQDG